MKVLAIIPAYNEEKTIASVIDEIRQYKYVDILIINDGSIDRTAHIVKALNAEVINLPVNRGIGAAMRIGYQHAKENNYDIAIQIDADGQHDISRLNLLIKPVAEQGFEMVIGSRYVKKTQYPSTFFRYWGAKYFSFLIFVLHGKKIKDTTSGYRAVNKTVIHFFADHYPDYYPEVAMLSRILTEDYNVGEIAVEMKKRQGGRTSISLTDSVIYFFQITFICIRDHIFRKWRT